VKTIAVKFWCGILIAFAPCIQQEANANNQHDVTMPNASIELPDSTKEIKLTEFQIKRFFERVDKTEKCWIWTGSKNYFGYGTANWKGLPSRAHRISWIIHFDKIPKGMHILHKCDNPSCVNPKHLWIGTHTDNMRDRQAKGRANHACGENQWISKLSERDVREIRRSYAAGEMTQVALSKKFKVRQGSISGIILRKSWKHV
jgi:hypothetical protein